MIGDWEKWEKEGHREDECPRCSPVFKHECGGTIHHQTNMEMVAGNAYSVYICDKCERDIYLT